jgi:hypothetical protein
MKPRTALLLVSLLVNAFAFALLLKQPGGISGAFAAVGSRPGAGQGSTAGTGNGSRPAAGGMVNGATDAIQAGAAASGQGSGSASAPAAVTFAGAAFVRAGGAAQADAFAARIGTAAPSSIPNLFKELAGMTPSKHRDDLLAQLYQRWGEVDPEKAMASVANLPLPERQAREGDIMKGWAMADPAAVMDWMEANPPPLTSTSSNPPNAARFNALADALLAADRPDLLSAAMAHATDPAYKSQLAVKLADYLARYDAGNGLNWLLSLPAGAVRNNAAARFARTISEEEPGLGLQLAANLPANAGRNQAITAVFKQWADSGDTGSAEAWLSGQKPSAANDNTLLAFLPVAAGRDSDLAARLLGQFVNPDNRQKAIDQAATKIALVDPARAVDWMLSYSPPTADRLKKLEPIVKAWLKADPTGAINRLPSLPGLTQAEREAANAVVNPPPKK